MHYWERWIGAWKAKTVHLNPEKKGLYGELLDHLYATELPLPSDHEKVYRIAGAMTQSERESCDAVLAEYMTKTESGYINKRTTEEIERRRSYVAGQRERANKRWTKPDANGEVKPKPDANGEVKPKPDAHAAKIVFPAWLDADQFNRWIKIRPAKARTPDAQQAAIGKLEKLRAAGHDGNAIVSESLANGWQGLFKPDPKQSQQSPVNHSPSLQRKPCAYCNAPSIGRVNQIDHCRAHSEAATFHEPLPRGKNDAITSNT